MINLRNIDVEYLTGALFGAFALILSVLIGFISGNRISLILFRTFVNVILFSIIGTACMFVIKKFVPEIYQIIDSVNSAENVEVKSEELTNESVNEAENSNEIKSNINESAAQDIPSHDNRDDAELEREFSGVDKHPAEFSSFDVKEKDLNIISRDNQHDRRMKYEPKIAAQAIRTMMKKDE